MAKLEIAYSLLAKDNASKVMKGVGDSAEKTGKRVGGAFGGLGKTLTGAFAGFAAVSVFKGFIEGAEESRKIGRLTEQVIKTTGGAAKITAGQVGELASAISNKTGADDEAIQSGANLLLTFTNVQNAVGKGNDIFNQATAMALDMSTVLGGDAKSSAIQLGKALNDPVKGVSALSKAGVSFTAGQKKQIKTMVEAGDTLGAQKIIMAELGKEFGGAAAAAGTPMDKLRVITGNLGEAVGTALLPMVDKFATFMGANLMPTLSKVGDYLKTNFSPTFETLKLSVSALFAAFKDGDVTSDGAVGAFERIGVALRNVNAKLQPVFRFIKDHAKPILIGLAVGLAFLVAPFTMTAAALVFLYARFSFFRTGVAAVATFITGTVVPAFQRLAAFFMANVLPALIKVGGFLVTTFTPTFKALSAYLTGSLIPAVQGLAKRVMENKPQLLALGKAIGTVAAVVAFLAAKIIGFLLPVIIKLQGFVVGSLFSALGKLIGIIGGVVRFVSALGAGFATATIKIKAAVTGAATWVSTKFTSIVTTVKGMPGKITSAASGMFDGIKSAFRGAINFVINAWNGLEFRIPGFDPPGPGPTFPGFTLGVPNIPQLAQGGIVKRRPGGILANIGEGKYDEAVIPLDGKSRRTGGSGSSDVHVHFHGPVSGENPTAFARAVQTELLRLKRTLGGELGIA